MEVRVVRSARRRKTVEAKLVDGVIRLAIPAELTDAEEAHWVEVMRERFLRKAATDDVDLVARAHTLAGDYDLPEPTTIEWSEQQRALWGSCSVQTGRVRIASRLIGFPLWVLDYVVVHELAHLVEPRHTRRFWDLVNRYPLAERARGYLIAKGEEEA